MSINGEYERIASNLEFKVHIGEQLVAAQSECGLRVNVMVVGESGLGKSTFLYNLTHLRGAAILERLPDAEITDIDSDIESSSTGTQPGSVYDLRANMRKMESNEWKQDDDDDGGDDDNIDDDVEDSGDYKEEEEEEEKDTEAEAEAEAEAKAEAEAEEEEEVEEEEKKKDEVESDREGVEGEVQMMKLAGVKEVNDESEDENEECLEEPPDVLKAKTVHISKTSYQLVSEDSIHTHIDLIDTPGFGDEMNTERHYEPIQEYIEEQFQRFWHSSHGQLLHADDTTGLRIGEDTRVHLCFYFIAPHRLKEIDVVFMRRLQHIVNIVPIIAKADSMTTQEMSSFKAEIRQRLQEENISLHSFDNYDTCYPGVDAQGPFSVACSRESVRQYPWGCLDTENRAHSDLSTIRELLFKSNLVSVVTKTHLKYEDSYAAQRRFQRTFSKTMLDRQLHRVKVEVTKQKRARSVDEARRRLHKVIYMLTSLSLVVMVVTLVVRKTDTHSNKAELEAELKACKEQLSMMRAAKHEAEGWAARRAQVVGRRLLGDSGGCVIC